MKKPLKTPEAPVKTQDEIERERWQKSDEQKAYAKAHKLKLFNGPGYDPKDRFSHVSVCAKTRKRAIEILNEAGLRTSGNSFSTYFAHQWGTDMAYITPEEGIWAEFRNSNRKIVRIK